MNAEKPSKAVIYCRVSSQKQVTEGHGLESQRVRAEEFTKLRGLDVVEVFKDDMTGAAIGRPGMKAMLAFLKSKREPYAVIIDDVSRLARSMEAHISLREKIRVAGGVLMSPTLEFGEDSDSQLVEHLLASVSQHARQKIAETTSNRMRGRMMNGYWTFRCPIGYRFQRHSEHGKILVRDEPVATLIQEVFEGFASGRFQGPAEILRYLEVNPAWPKSRRERMTIERVLELLERVHYAGYLHYPEWGIYMKPAKHEGIISLATFTAVQDKLKGNAKVPARKDLAEDFSLRGFVVCDDCGEPYRSCWSKGRNGRYAYYLCQTKGCRSYGKSIRREVMEQAFEDVLRSLTPSPHLYALASACLREFWQEQLERSEGNRSALVAEVKAIEGQIEQLVDRIVSAGSQSLITAYENRILSLEGEKAKREEVIANCGRAVGSFDDTHRTAMEFLENPYNSWIYGSFEDRRDVLKCAFDDRVSYAREYGFRTVPKSLPFNIFNDLGGSESCDSEMVRFFLLCTITRNNRITKHGYRTIDRHKNIRSVNFDIYFNHVRKKLLRQ